MGLKVDTSSLETFKKQLEALRDDMAEINRQYLELEAEEIIKEAKENTPVDTGALRASFEMVDATEDSITIRNNQDYASHIEFGQRSYQGRYMLTNAANNAGLEREKRYENYLKKRG